MKIDITALEKLETEEFIERQIKNGFKASVIISQLVNKGMSQSEAEENVRMIHRRISYSRRRGGKTELIVGFIAFIFFLSIAIISINTGSVIVFWGLMVVSIGLIITGLIKFFKPRNDR